VAPSLDTSCCTTLVVSGLQWLAMSWISRFGTSRRRPALALLLLLLLPPPSHARSWNSGCTTSFSSGPVSASLCTSPHVPNVLGVSALLVLGLELVLVVHVPLVVLLVLLVLQLLPPPPPPPPASLHPALVPAADTTATPVPVTPAPHR
jgi:hypothetical protein